MSKIKTLDELAEIIRDLKRDGKIIVHCHGVFDLLHPGHIKHFEAAKHEGDILIVTVTQDEYVGKGLGRPVFNQRLRVESIAALECVDIVTFFDEKTPYNAINMIKPHFVVKGGDYQPDEVVGKDIVEKYGGEVKIIPFEKGFSSTKILDRIKKCQ